jgi:hypothetical protein
MNFGGEFLIRAKFREIDEESSADLLAESFLGTSVHSNDSCSHSFGELDSQMAKSTASAGDKHPVTCFGMCSFESSID